MKLKTILFSVILLIAGMKKSNAQTAQHDSLRIHIMENKNGNMTMIDTVVPVSQHDQLMQWLSIQGIDMPEMPEGHDSMKVEIITIDNDGDSLQNGMRMMQSTLPPAAPLPPPAPGQKMRIMEMPPPSGTDGKKCRVVIVCDTVVNGENMKTKSENGTQPSQQKVVVKNTPDAKAMNVFPNPSNGHITVNIDMPGKEKANLTITDMNGKIIYAEQLGTATEKISKEIDLSKFGKGMYSVEVDKGGQVIVEKISVE